MEYRRGTGRLPFTKYGDGGVDVLPIGRLYKTRVRQLARYLGVPSRVVVKPSSPRLWPWQTAEEELGVTYEFVDSILYLRFEKWLPEEKIAEEFGVDPSVVGCVLEKVRRSQHKRLMPEVFHIGHRDLGSDWRYPRRWL